MAIQNKNVNENPRMSINKLAEYLQANANRRKAIVKDQKFPQEILVSWYTEARIGIVNYFSNDFNKEVLESTITSIVVNDSDSDFQKKNKNSSIEALQKMKGFEIPKILHNCEIKSYRGKVKKIEIAGVEISINPDLILKTKNKKGDPVVGGIKLHFSKNQQLGKDSRENVAMVMKKFLEENYSEKADGELCLSIDVFSDNVSSSPKAEKRRYQNIESACEEISSRWSRPAPENIGASFCPRLSLKMTVMNKASIRT